MSDNSILDKIRKLVALGQSPNENEAQVAMSKARELMIEYKISQGEVDAHEVKNKKFVERKVDTWCTKYNDPWLLTLCGVIARAHCCDYYITHRYGGKKLYMTIIGFEEDVNMSEFVFYYAMDSIYSILKYKMINWKNQYPWYNKSDLRVFRDSYAKGFISGVRNAYRKQDEENQEYGLVMVTPQEVTDYMNNITSTMSTDSGRAVNHREWSKGYEEGTKFDINRMTSGAAQLTDRSNT